ncbi:H-X9-DG-CTERM domain-containing protein [Limnoglobus roseus]|uniref:DUF1559 domain-containing protein n=1 Tax=Limnoglobus roseus TaxID=2598579 RepID=A0A5C1A6Y2_9BACT|nr:H-X9-DG-CTERM domain-containing protein [Limnoglobus roseus]QEL13592.1 hypothetical protein PX52LOC_00450 [Limnoglobus roseus]
MRAALTVGILVAALVLFGIATTVEGAFTVVFGWIPFLVRVLPEAKPDGPTVTLGGIALLLFTAGVHALGRSFRPGWRVRWTAAVVVGVVLLFTAGISVIGITHQLAWLAISEQPLRSERLARGGNAEYRANTISTGLINYHDINRVFPPGGTFSSTGEMRHSWETHILPHLSYWDRDIDWNSPWNGPENQKIFRCVLPDFINSGFRTPALEDGNGFGLSHYAANKSMALADITKGTSETILAGEVNAGFRPWGHPINGRDPAAGLNAGPKTFGGPPNAGGTNFIMADGSVHFLGNGVDPAVLRALALPTADR